MTILKKAAAIHDLSGLGHSSLAAVMPILSVMGVQVCAMPTAILSSQTDGYEGYSFVDLTNTLPQFIKHWERLQLDFQCIYSGFLGSAAQIALVSDFIAAFRRPDTLVVVDPVLGDDGALYDTMDEDMVREMRGLVARADVITPNFTELLLLAGESYRLEASDREIRGWMRSLAESGPRIVLVTSVPAGLKNQTQVWAYDRERAHFCQVACEYIPVSYPGTGDIFTSVLTGRLLQQWPLEEAIADAAAFVAQAIRLTMAAGSNRAEGVQLELVLPLLLDKREKTACKEGVQHESIKPKSNA